MQTLFISTGHADSVPCVYNITGREKAVCVIVHGFGSSKTSPTAAMMLTELPPLGVGAIAFDFPAHGESKTGGESLRIANCLTALAAAETRARTLAPTAEIVYFASSFGAYITLIYLTGQKQSRRRAFLRSAAVTMPQVVKGLQTQAEKALLEKTGEILLSQENYGYELKLTQGFFDDLENHDVFTLWRKGLAELHMVHGQSDQTIPLRDARSFADRFHVPLTVVPGGDHRLSIPGAPERVLQLAATFFLGWRC
ncbi:MAG: alpha/beta hydrolase [Peptococcaceae bacterium]|nr:alpha/beta hydrolase [Peptococcaceae bacterium]